MLSELQNRQYSCGIFAGFAEARLRLLPMVDASTAIVQIFATMQSRMRIRFVVARASMRRVQLSGYVTLLRTGRMVCQCQEIVLMTAGSIYSR